MLIDRALSRVRKRTNVGRKCNSRICSGRIWEREQNLKMWSGTSIKIPSGWFSLPDRRSNRINLITFDVLVINFSFCEQSHLRVVQGFSSACRSLVRDQPKDSKTPTNTFWKNAVTRFKTWMRFSPKWALPQSEFERRDNGRLEWN